MFADLLTAHLFQHNAARSSDCLKPFLASWDVCGHDSMTQ